MESINNLVIELLMKILSGLYGNIELTQTIDKAFILGYNFDKNGKFIKWSPLQLLYDLDLFDRSLKISVPSGKTFAKGDYKLVQSSNSASQDMYMNDLLTKYHSVYYMTSEELQRIVEKNNNQEDLTSQEQDLIDLLNSFNIDTSSEYALDAVKIELLSLIIDQCEKVGGIYCRTLNADFINDLTETLDTHNSYVADSGGIKNSITYQMHLIMNDPKNFVSAYKSIDVSVRAFKDPIEGIKETRIYNTDDGHTPSAVTKAGATGKDNVGVAANGTKVYFTLLNYTNQIQEHDEPLDIQELLESDSFNLQRIDLEYTTTEDTIDPMGNPITVERKKYWKANISLIADTVVSDGVIDLYNELLSKSRESFNSYVSSRLSEDPTLTLEDLQQEYDNLGKLYLYLRDASQAVGSFVSMSADNAKDLCLDKMNASTDLFCMHVYLAMIGCPPNVIVDLFSSKEFKTIYNSIASDVTKGKKPLISQDLFVNAPGFWDLYELALFVTTISHTLSINQGTAVDKQKIATQANRLANIYEAAMREVESSDGYFSKTEADNHLAAYPSNVFALLAAKRVPLANLALKDAEVTIKTPFDMARFTTDPVYADAIIKSYGVVVPVTWNVFDVVDKVPHFHKMFEKYSQVIEGCNASSVAFRYMTSEARSIYNPDLIQIPFYTTVDPTGREQKIFQYTLAPDLQSTDISTVEAAVINTMFENFITDVVAPKAKFTYTGLTDSGIVKYDCKFKSDKDIHTFMEFVTNVLIPNLQVNAGGKNMFLARLKQDSEAAKNIGALLYVFSQDLNRINSKEVGGNSLLNAITEDFEKIKNIKISSLFNSNQFTIADKNITVGDFLYLYTKIAKMIYPKGRNFERLFKQYDPAEFSTQFNDFVSEIDAGHQPFELDPELLMTYIVRKKVKWTKSGEKKVVYNRPLEYDGVSDYNEFKEHAAQGEKFAEMLLQKRVSESDGSYRVTYMKYMIGLKDTGIPAELRQTAKIVDGLKNIDMTSVNQHCSL